MPPHPDRVRRNYCEHEWIEVLGYGVISEFTGAPTHIAMYCPKCGRIADSREIIELDRQS